MDGRCCDCFHVISKDSPLEDSPQLSCLWCAHKILKSHWKCRSAMVVVSHWALFVFCISVCFCFTVWCVHTQMRLCACMCVGVTMGGDVFHWWKFKYIQALVWEPTCQCTMSQRSFWWKGKGEEKETSGFGSKHWISFQAWTLHWAFQQMSKSLLAVDRQPNGPQHRKCGRAMEEEEMETKGKHKGKMVYATFFCHVQSSHSWRRLKKFMSLPRHFFATFHSVLWQLLWFIFPFFMLCFVVETREKLLMNRSTAPAVSALTDKHWRHSEMHKSLKDDGDELKASFWLIFPATQCFDMRETSQKLKHDQDASHESAWEEIVDEYFSIQTSDSCTVGLLSHTVHLSNLIPI